MKNKIEAQAEKLNLSEVQEKLWTHLMVDFITKLSLVVEKDVILVVCGRLSKMIYFVAITKGTIVKGLARLFRDNMWKLYELPKSVMLNRGLQFAAELIKKLNKMLGIEMKLSMAFYPQIDGQIKRMNQELE